jgi:hypothetical protein
VDLVEYRIPDLDYFARSPDSKVWVWFGDLPKRTERVLTKSTMRLGELEIDFGEIDIDETRDKMGRVLVCAFLHLMLRLLVFPIGVGRSYCVQFTMGGFCP